MRSVRALNEAGPCIALGLVLRETESCIRYRDRRGIAKLISKDCPVNGTRLAGDDVAADLNSVLFTGIQLDMPRTAVSIQQSASGRRAMAGARLNGRSGSLRYEPKAIELIVRRPMT